MLLFLSVKIRIICCVKMMQSVHECENTLTLLSCGGYNTSTRRKKGLKCCNACKTQHLLWLTDIPLYSFRGRLCLPHRLIVSRYCGKLISHMVLEALVTDTEMQWCLSGSLSSSSHGKLAVHLMTLSQNRNSQFWITEKFPLLMLTFQLNISVSFSYLLPSACSWDIRLWLCLGI